MTINGFMVRVGGVDLSPSVKPCSHGRRARAAERHWRSRSPHPAQNHTKNLSFRKGLLYGAGGGSRTPVSALGRLHNSRYTTPACLLSYHKWGFYRSRLTFGEPETSRQQASLLRKISLRPATGGSHPISAFTKAT